ncbi:MAG: citrate/2-methylcitrate synthase [Gallintestinimicrobium sp.]
MRLNSTQYDVKRGLRDLNGKGVLAGLTNISDVRATKIVNGEAVPAHGQLFYRGYNVESRARLQQDNRFDFDEVTYLLLFNKLPNKEELELFPTARIPIDLPPALSAILS